MQYQETNLVLNWEKDHFMVQEGIVLGHKVSFEGIEVDPTKIDVIRNHPVHNSSHEYSPFLGMHAYTSVSSWDFRP